MILQISEVLLCNFIKLRRVYKMMKRFEGIWVNAAFLLKFIRNEMIQLIKKF